MNDCDTPLSAEAMREKFQHHAPGRGVRIHECRKSGLCLVSDFYSDPGALEEMWWVQISDINFGPAFPGESVSRDDPPPQNKNAIAWARERSSLLHDLGDLVNAHYFGLQLNS